jgi:hypothetical protein
MSRTTTVLGTRGRLAAFESFTLQRPRTDAAHG